MATSIQQAHEVPRDADPFVRRETVRLVGALAALLPSALLATGGLIWREHARAHARTTPPAAASQR